MITHHNIGKGIGEDLKKIGIGLGKTKIANPGKKFRI